MENSRFEGSRENLKAAFKLISRYEWLGDRTDELLELLFDDCKTDSQRELVTELFDRFHYVTQTQLSSYIQQLADIIINIPSLNPSNTIVVAMANDSSPDSSQSLLQYLKVQLERKGWRGIQMLNRADHAFKASGKTEFAKKNIVVVDEFIGSGKTAIGKRDLLERQFKNAGYQVNVFVRVIFCSSLGLDNISKSKVNLEFLQEIKRGITDFYPPEDASPKIDLIKTIEDGLAEICGSHRIEECSLGYGGTESLFAIENANIPNSVFPIFWWPERKGGAVRQPIFTRFMGE